MEPKNLSDRDVSAALTPMLATLRSIDRSLADIISTLPEPIFEEGSDCPLNAAAALHGLLAATRQDEILPAIRSLTRALEIVSDVREELP